ncbi:recombinase family protein [Streptomyces sp. NPDC005181]|uniref:recombinase family protein n=1 Tax=Streptomyces sp. NPDC005181 TaxID=3156869 RepID=UPI0033AA0AAC
MVDLGPHPNPAKAADGKRLHGLEPDPVTAPIVVRIFTEYLSGLGIFAIAEGLTRDGILSPSAYDRTRNPHRDTRAWSKSAVRAVLTNPRYTGRQVWNRQRKHESLMDITDVTLGYTTTMKWNGQDKWIVSKKIVHTPLINDEIFARVDRLLHKRATTGAAHVQHRTRNPYLFRGRITCDSCDRRMQGQWSHGEPYYRCRFPEEYALANSIEHPRNVYLREAWVIPSLDTWLTRVFSPHRLYANVDALAGAASEENTADTSENAARAAIAECDRKLATHRSALEAGADPTLVTRWIAETQAHRARAEAVLRTAARGPAGPMSREEITRLVDSIKDLAAVVSTADPADKAEIYRQLGLRLSYTPGSATTPPAAPPSAPRSIATETARTTENPHGHRVTVGIWYVRVRGGSGPIPHGSRRWSRS